MHLPAVYAAAEDLIVDDFNDGDMKNNVSGEWEVWLRTEDDPSQSCKMSFVKEEALGPSTPGQSAQLDYDVDSANPAYNGIRTYLHHLDASGYGFLNLYVKGDAATGFPPSLKIELIGPSDRPSPYMLTGITDQWQKFSIPFTEFFLIKDWTKVEKFVVVFADITSNPKVGRVYIDHVTFSKDK